MTHLDYLTIHPSFPRTKREAGIPENAEPLKISGILESITVQPIIQIIFFHYTKNWKEGMNKMANNTSTLESAEKIGKEIDRIFNELPRIKTCKDSLLPEGRLWCSERNKSTVGGILLEMPSI